MLDRRFLGVGVGVKMQDVKITDQTAGRTEIAGR